MVVLEGLDQVGMVLNVIMEGLMDIRVTMEGGMVINGVTGDLMAISPIMKGVVVIMGTMEGKIVSRGLSELML